jgi:hypothetical protein
MLPCLVKAAGDIHTKSLQVKPMAFTLEPLGDNVAYAGSERKPGVDTSDDSDMFARGGVSALSTQSNPLNLASLAMTTAAVLLMQQGKPPPQYTSACFDAVVTVAERVSALQKERETRDTRKRPLEVTASGGSGGGGGGGHPPKKQKDAVQKATFLCCTRRPPPPSSSSSAYCACPCCKEECLKGDACDSFRARKAKCCTLTPHCAPPRSKQCKCCRGECPNVGQFCEKLDEGE